MLLKFSNSKVIVLPFASLEISFSINNTVNTITSEIGRILLVIYCINKQRFKKLVNIYYHKIVYIVDLTAEILVENLWLLCVRQNSEQHGAYNRMYTLK